MCAALVLRGNIRDAFTTSQLRSFVALCASHFKTLHVYAQTWENNFETATHKAYHYDTSIASDRAAIDSYLGPTLAKHIQFHTTIRKSDIRLVGAIHGAIPGTPKVQRQGWKNMWFGKWKVMQAVVSSGVAYDVVINTRWDLFTRFAAYHAFSGSKFTVQRAFAFATQSPGLPVEQAVDRPQCNDNLYKGTPEALMRLATTFHLHLDDVTSRVKLTTTAHEEYVQAIVRRINAQGVQKTL
jgi:hypothetical protein